MLPETTFSRGVCEVMNVSCVYLHAIVKLITRMSHKYLSFASAIAQIGLVTYSLAMGRAANGEPNEFAKGVSAEMRKELGNRRISGRKIALFMGKSEAYVRIRLADQTDFSLNDVESFCQALELDPVSFIERVESIAPVTELRPSTNVSGSRHDYLATVELDPLEIAASRDNTNITPDRGEA